jgi:nucleotide-binding universal stress UspA family protein
MTAITAPVSVGINNVLIATDLLPASETALRVARAIAAKHQARLQAVHVAADYYQLLEPEPLNITFRELPEAANRPTEALQRLFTGLPTQLPLESGEIWEVLNEIIRRRQIDLLVLGTHARHGLERLIHGSIAEEVLRNAICPVLTVGPDVHLSGEANFDIRRVLLATDFDSHSDAGRWAAAFSNQCAARLTVVRVKQGRASDDLKAKMRSFVEALDVWTVPEAVIENGEPAEKIVETANRTKPELIVLGARHQEPAKINSHLPRPTIAKVVARAGCPVLTVRQVE